MSTPAQLLAELRDKLFADGWDFVILTSNWLPAQSLVASGQHRAFVRVWPVGMLTRANVFQTVCDVELELVEHVAAPAGDDSAPETLIDSLPALLLPTWWTDLAAVYALESDGEPQTATFERVAHRMARAIIKATVVLTP